MLLAVVLYPPCCCNTANFPHAGINKGLSYFICYFSIFIFPLLWGLKPLSAFNSGLGLILQTSDLYH